MHLDPAACYGAVQSRDRRFDGVFYTAVHSTGIYCRPSCPARTPRVENVSFHPTAAAAHAAGFRACRRCLPDATPGSPRWDLAADLAGRAMRLVADGVVEREGVEGLARRLDYSSRHLNRLLQAELGAGPLALARAHRAQTARILIDTTDLAFADVAFAAGFASVRQFNDTIREVYAATPSALRRVRRAEPATGTIELQLGVRTPYAAAELLSFLVRHRVAGVEAGGVDWFARTLRLPHGGGSLQLELTEDPSRMRLRLRLADLRDTAAAVERARRLLDADADPSAVDSALARDAALRPLVRRHPGLRVPGHVDGFEGAVRTVLGQQVSIASAGASAARLTREHGSQFEAEAGGTAGDDAGIAVPTLVFPSPEQLAQADPEQWALPRRRAATVHRLATEVAEGRLELDRGVDRDAARSALLALPGIGPWTVDVLAMRAWGDPDAWLPTDLGTRQAMGLLGIPPEAAESWRPWRSYAQSHLWQLVLEQPHRNRPIRMEATRCGP